MKDLNDNEVEFESINVIRAKWVCVCIIVACITAMISK